MQTVIRDDKGKITHQHLWGRMFVTVADYKVITETQITPQMIENYGLKHRPLQLLREVINGDVNELEAKRLILKSESEMATANQIELENDNKYI